LKFIIDNWPLLLLASVSGGMLLWPLIKGGAAGGSTVSTAEAVRLINREKGVLIDICEPTEFANGHAAGARNVPLAQLEGAKALPTNKSLPVLVLCATGARSSRAVGLLRKAGFEKALAVAGGTAAWREAQLPIEKGA
jgi:rhodanese-related sulfurtransferase